MTYQSKIITNSSKHSLVDTNSTGLVSAYDFKNGSLRDLVGTNHGTQIGSLDFEETSFGTFARFDKQGALNLGAGFSSQKDWFVSFWMRMTDSSNSSYIINQFESVASAFGVARNTSNDIYIVDDIDNAGTVRYQTSLQNGVIYHIVFGINDSNLCKMWINGVPADNDESASSGFETIGGAMYIGAREPTLSANITVSPIGNVEIYNQDLTDTIVQTIYNRGKGIVSKFENGIIASENLFGAGSFLENTPYEVIDKNQKIVSGTVNGYDSKILKYTGNVSLGRILSSNYASTPQQASYGTWQFTFNKANSGSLCQFGFANNRDGIGSGSGYVLQFETDESIRLLYYGLSTLIDTVTAVITPGQFHTFRITRNYAGVFKLWIDRTYIGTGTNTAYTSADCFYFSSQDIDDQFVLSSDNPEYSFWHSPLVIEP